LEYNNRQFNSYKRLNYTVYSSNANIIEIRVTLINELQVPQGLILLDPMRVGRKQKPHKYNCHKI
jgi:hypothetical protein